MRTFLRPLAMALLAGMGGCTSQHMKPAPHDYNIYLQVRNSSGGSDGYYDAQSSSGTYSCKYEGGGGHGGDVTVAEPHGNPANINVHLKPASGTNYVMATAYVLDPNGQIVLDPSQLNKNIAVFKDINTASTSAYYEVVVADVQVSIYCDPKITNN